LKLLKLYVYIELVGVGNGNNPAVV